jgi:stage III sporulation protein AG
MKKELSDDLISKIKGFLLKKDNLLICVLTGILLLVVAWPVGNGKESSEEDTISGLWGSTDRTETASGAAAADGGSPGETLADEQEDIAEALEQRLTDILSVMEGVGKVKVMVTLSSTGEKVVEKDSPVTQSSVTETDSAGGSRSTSEISSQETTVYVTDSQGEKTPYVIQEKSPVVEGVSVVAQGGGDSQIQKNITEVIQALFGIEAHKIKVVKMKQEE